MVTHHLEEFVRQSKWALTSRQVFRWLQETRPETLTDVQRAARFFTCSSSRSGARWRARPSAPPPRRRPSTCCGSRESLSAAHLRLAGGTYIEQLDWAECVDRYDRPHSPFFLDPRTGKRKGYGVSLSGRSMS